MYFDTHAHQPIWVVICLTFPLKMCVIVVPSNCSSICLCAPLKIVVDGGPCRMVGRCNIGLFLFSVVYCIKLAYTTVKKTLNNPLLIGICQFFSDSDVLA